MTKLVAVVFVIFAALLVCVSVGIASDDQAGEASICINGATHEGLASQPVGGRIAAWAERFVGTPYDPVPIGIYVESEKIVCDSEVDCMYLVFRSAELGTSDNPEEANERALELRFITKGRVEDGLVANYDERFQYAEDMIASGKWGDEVTAKLGDTVSIPGDRGRDSITILPKGEAMKPDTLSKFKDGDIVYFVKDPKKRVVGEVIGHLGVIKVEGEGPMLIHASGSKKSKTREGGGEVKKVSFEGYLSDTKFIGVQVTRFRD
jgi:hypothetical protein